LHSTRCAEAVWVKGSNRKPMNTADKVRATDIRITSGGNEQAALPN
jgi:hypothetical protein